jgi:hypothetical protein
MIQFSACKILQVSYKVFEALSKTAPKIVHYKARPPHTAILDSLGPPARPHHPCNPWICNWRDAAADVRVNFKVVGVDFEVFYRDQSSYPKLSRSCAGHLRTVPNGSEAPPNGSERFRGPLCRFTSGFYEWFACRFRSARSLGSFL